MDLLLHATMTEKSKQWILPSEPAPKKVKMVLSVGKIMAIICSPPSWRKEGQGSEEKMASFGEQKMDHNTPTYSFANQAKLVELRY